jgi:hypothetical protein
MSFSNDWALLSRPSSPQGETTVGSLERRLEDLEARADKSREDERAAESREVLRRMTDDELSAYLSALCRLKAESAPLDEDRAILDRVTQLYDEVRSSEF